MFNSLVQLWQVLMTSSPDDAKKKEREEALIRRIIAGETAAESELIALFSKAVRVQVQRKVGYGDDWKDVAQETFMALILALREGKFDPERGRLGAFIFGVTRIKIVDYIKGKVKKEKREFKIEPWMMEIFSSINLPMYLEKEEQLRILRECFSALKDRYQMVIKMYDHMEMSMREVGENIGKSEQQTIDLRRHGLRLLKDCAQSAYF